ncbi:MAG: ROK family protein [Bacteroidetes bacterium]|nr:ROK family protein [Bacteroidota bacterium]
MKKCYIGIDIGKTNMRFAVTEEEPVLKYYTKRKYSKDSKEGVFVKIFEGIDEALKESGYNEKDVQGIGISVPAVVDRETGVIAWGPQWDFLGGVSITKPLEERYGVPVVADVDPVMAAWGTQWAGIGKECDRYALLAWGTGLGAGFIIDGEVVENPNNLFPEFGHSVVSDDDWPCKCGATGCIDTLVCGGGIAKHGQLAVVKEKESILHELCGGYPSKLTSPMVFEAAEKGDKVAISVLERVATLLGRLCANIVLTMQPEKIVIVGGLAERSDFVLETINRVMSENCWLIFKGLTECEVICSELVDEAGVLGAIRKVQGMSSKTIK